MSDERMVLPAHLMKPTDDEEERMGGQPDDDRKPMRTVNVDPDETDGGWVATSPDVPGAAGQGETMAAAMLDLVDAVEMIRVSRAAAGSARAGAYTAELRVGWRAIGWRIARRVLVAARALLDRCWVVHPAATPLNVPVGRVECGSPGLTDRPYELLAAFVRLSPDRLRSLGLFLSMELTDLKADGELGPGSIELALMRAVRDVTFQPDLAASLDEADGAIERGETMSLDELFKHFGVTREELAQIPDDEPETGEKATWREIKATRAVFDSLAKEIIEVALECQRAGDTKPLSSLADRVWEGEPPSDLAELLVDVEIVRPRERRLSEVLQGIRGVIFGNAADLAPKKRDELRAIHDLALYGLYGDKEPSYADAPIIAALLEGRLD